jgi:mannonate dehydratase
MEHSAATNSVFLQTMTFEDGYLHPGDAPGLGVELDEQAAASFPYRPAYLPVSRLQDGTVHDW